MLVTQDQTTLVHKGPGFYWGEMKEQHPKLDYLRPKTVVMLFDGVDVMLDTIRDKMKTTGFPYDSSESTGRDGFNSFDTYQEAMDTFRNHPEKVSEFDPAELRIKDANESGTQVDYDVVGDYIDMGRYMEGIPEVMGQMHNGNARNRRVNVILNLNQQARIGHEVIKHRGERILRLVDALEAGGVRCMITAIESSECDHVEVVVKQHEEAMTVHDLAVVSHPEFLRRAIFRIIEQSKTINGGYGNAGRFGHLLTPELADSGSNDELDIIVDGNFYDEEGVDDQFDKLEKLLVWEMSKPVPEVTSVKIGADGLYFNPNGYRSEEEIRREGLEVIKDEE